MANLNRTSGAPARLRPNQIEPFEGKSNRHGVRDLDAAFNRKRREERQREQLEAEAVELDKAAASRLCLAEEWQARADMLRAEAAEKQAEAARKREQASSSREQRAK